MQRASEVMLSQDLQNFPRKKVVIKSTDMAFAIGDFTENYMEERRSFYNQTNPLRAPPKQL